MYGFRVVFVFVFVCSFFQICGYLYWLAENSYFFDITLHYLVAGHTKFAPDRMFGRVSRILKNQNIFEVDNAVRLVNAAAQKGLTALELTPDMRIMYDWKGALSEHLAMPGGIDMKRWIRARRQNSRVVMEWKEWHSDPWSPITILKTAD